MPIDDSRMKVIDDLVVFRSSLDDIKHRLLKFPFDYAGTPYKLTADAVRNIINLFDRGEISADDLYEWANLVEMRDDIEADCANADLKDWILTAVLSLANPEIDGQSIETALRSIKADYDRVVRR